MRDEAEEDKDDGGAYLNGETEIMSLATPICGSPSAVNAGSVESFAKDKLDERMSKVRFANTPEELMKTCAEAMSTQPRVVVLVDGVTTEKEAFGTMIDVAKQVWDLYAQGTGASPGEQTKFRIVILLGSRWDLLDKVSKKAAALFPKFSKFKVQIEAREWQSRCSRPTDAIVLCPAEELGREPNVLQVKACQGAFVSDGVRLRCTNPKCIWRSQSAGLTGSAEEQADVDEADKVDLLSAMLDEEAEQGDGDEDDGPGGIPAPGPEAEKVKAMLWPYGRMVGYYHKVLESMCQSRKASTAVVISTTAHPGHWVACTQQGLETCVFTRRWTNHSKQHGLALGRKILLEEAVKDLQSGCAANGKPDESPTFQFLRIALPEGVQIIEAYDVHQQDSWHDGLNHTLPSNVLEPQSARLTPQSKINSTSVLLDPSVRAAS